MIKDTKVVDLAAWKRKKEEEELASLKERVEALVEEYADELEPAMWPSAFEDDALSTLDWLSMWDNKTYNSTGMANYADIVLEPTAESCTKTLAWVSYILSDMGMKTASDMVEEVIRHIDSDNA